MAISQFQRLAQMVKNLPAMQEMRVQSLDQEDPLEKEMVTCSSILPGEIHGQRSLVGYSPWGHKESDIATNTFTSLKKVFVGSNHVHHGVSENTGLSRNVPRASCQDLYQV